MTIQSLPAFYDMQFTKEDGRLSGDGYLYLDQQFQTLNYSVNAINGTVSTYVQKSVENPFLLISTPAPKTLVIIGINPPSYTTAQINAISVATSDDGSPLVPVGTIWYDSTMDKLRFKGASTIQTITST